MTAFFMKYYTITYVYSSFSVKLSWEANYFINDMVNALKFVFLHDKNINKIKTSICEMHIALRTVTLGQVFKKD